MEFEENSSLIFNKAVWPVDKDLIQIQNVLNIFFSFG